MAVLDSGASTAGKANVDSNFNLQVNSPTNANNAGFVVLAAELNSGNTFGSREVFPLNVSEERRLSVGIDSVLFNDSFNYNAQNTSNYRYPATTQTLSHTTTVGYVTLNSGSSAATNTNCAIQTYSPFPIFGGFEIRARMAALHTVAPQVNAVTEWGLFSATLPGAAIPTDGVYFRFTATGAFVCVINYNGAETTSASLTIPAANENHSYELRMNEEAVIFYVDGEVVFDIDTPAGFAQPFASGCLPFTARHYIAGVAPALAMQFKIGSLDINLGDMNTTKPWAHVMCSQGFMAYQGQNGGTMGSTALYTNSLAAGAGAVMTNTTAALGTGLGGQFSVLPTLAVGTDGIVCDYTNPAGSTIQTPRSKVITGIRIQGAVTTALVGNATPLVYAYSAAYGHTAVSLATAESATAKAPRRVPLGFESFGAAAALGTLGGGVSIKLDAPIVVAPGEHIAICAKNLGAATATGVITFLVGFDAYEQ